MRLSLLFIVTTLTVSMAWFLSCSSDNGSSIDSDCQSETVTGLSAYTSQQDSADFCVVIQGVVSFGVTNQCPGGFYLKDSLGATDSIYLDLGGKKLNAKDFPEIDSLSTPAQVVGNFRPGEVLCTEILCHCQRKLRIETVKKQ